MKKKTTSKKTCKAYRRTTSVYERQWTQVLRKGPTWIAKKLGCPVPTAASWICRSGPPKWQIPIYLRAIDSDSTDSDWD